MHIFNRLILHSKGNFHKCARSRLLCYFIDCNRIKPHNFLSYYINQRFSSNVPVKPPDDLVKEKELVVKQRVFKQIARKDKESFLQILEVFNEKGGMKRGHVEFIFAAMQCMDEFGVKTDLEIYKKLLDIFPKGKMIPRNLIQAEFQHYPRQQDCAIELLDEMENNAVYPDKELKEIIVNIFGESSQVYKKYCRMLYWMPKFKNKNPYLPLDPLPSDIEELARLALRKMCVDLKTKLTHFKTQELESALDKTWIVSAQSSTQQKLLLEHSTDKPIYVEGPNLIWLRRLSLSYFVLKADPIYRTEYEIDDDDVSNLSLYMFGEPKPKELTVVPATIHEQEDSTVLGLCATGTSSKDSVVSWIHFLKRTNPILDKIPILFKLKSAQTALTALNTTTKSEETEKIDADMLKDVKDLIKEEIC